MANAIKKKPNNGWSGYLVYFLAISVVFLIIVYIMRDHGTVQEKNYNEVISLIENNETNEIKITEITFSPQTGDYNSNIHYLRMKTTDKNIVYEAKLYGPYALEHIEQAALDKNISMEVQPAKSYGGFFTILSFLFPILLIGIFAFIFFKNAGGNNKAFDFARSRAKLNKSKEVTFKDVAGQEEEKEELVEIIDFLKNPKKYNELGARIPKGVLLSGPPGTGKTLLARASAGEANVPFYSISGSDFVEMFVGVGASRVRDMFKTAKQNAPCIIFIDEIDAVGRQRGAGLGGGHDEREQTLNQLLAEMDGFGSNTGVIVMAATNRPDVLDPALLRPGRFDRQIMVTNPDVKGREEILKVHSRNKKFAPTVQLSEVAKRTPGFSGADLENLLNESALLAARYNRKVIEMQDIDEAMDRVLMGPAKKSRKYSKRDKEIVAFHEAGHAVIGLKLDNAEIVHKVTIIPRGQAGGYNLMLPEEEKFVQTKQDLLDQITGLLGGRVAEEIVFSEITTGAHNDFEKATKIARAMVTEFGMSSLGPVQYEQRSGNVFLGRDYMKDRNFSGQIALEIDKEVRRIIDECYERAQVAIKENRELLDLIANQLIEMETLTREDIEELVETGKVKWWDEKKAQDKKELEEIKKAEKEKAEKEKVEKEEEPKKDDKVDF
ncbi:ATP-dependent zinc metalloprotease FtsH [Mycoplasmatota bacterium]|nr:ATP-dependent zinc metalloprotease FtsH [Mycoplasmatota bacterium]